MATFTLSISTDSAAFDGVDDAGNPVAGGDAGAELARILRRLAATLASWGDGPDSGSLRDFNGAHRWPLGVVRMTRYGTRAFWDAFDAHMVDMADDGDVQLHIDNALVAGQRLINGRQVVAASSYAAAVELVNSGSLLFYTSDILNLFAALGLGKSYTRMDADREADRIMAVYAGMVGAWLSRHGYSAARKARQAELDKRCGRCGGPWGEDLTCENCCDDDGNARPHPQI